MAFLGGSAYAMARDVGEGYILLNTNMLRRMSAEELKQLRFEIDRLLNGVRGDQPSLDNVMAIQTRNRKISRLNSAVFMINSQLQTLR
jgi:hypothetical protein